jgi:hypothetical protein
MKDKEYPKPRKAVPWLYEKVHRLSCPGSGILYFSRKAFLVSKATSRHFKSNLQASEKNHLNEFVESTRCLLPKVLGLFVPVVAW